MTVLRLDDGTPCTAYAVVTDHSVIEDHYMPNSRSAQAAEGLVSLPKMYLPLFSLIVIMGSKQHMTLAFYGSWKANSPAKFD